MSLFEVMVNIASAFGVEVKPTGARAIRDSMPSPNAQPLMETTTDNAQPLQVDELGLLATRGQVLTDEGSFRDNFNTPSAALNTALGSCTFTTGSKTVTGTNFLTVGVSRDSYVRLTADGNTAWTRVARVISSTTIELEIVYPGAGGTGASEFTNWVQAVGAGGSLVVGSSLCSVTSGATNGSLTSIKRTVDAGPLRLEAKISISTRNVNQETTVGFASTSALGGIEEASFFFAANVATQATCRVKAQGGAFELLSLTLPNSLTTAASLVYAIELSNSEVAFYVEDIMVASFSNQIPSPYRELEAFVQIFNNGAVGGSVAVQTDYVAVENFNEVAVVSATASRAVSVMVAEDAQYHAANTTVASVTETSVIAFTVPAGKTLFMLGWSLYSDTATAAVVKMGRTAAPITDPGAVGVTNGNVFFTGVIAGTIGATIGENFGYTSVRCAVGGETLRITVTAVAATSTIWRSQLRFILR